MYGEKRVYTFATILLIIAGALIGVGAALIHDHGDLEKESKTESSQVQSGAIVGVSVGVIVFAWAIAAYIIAQGIMGDYHVSVALSYSIFVLSVIMIVVGLTLVLTYKSHIENTDVVTEKYRMFAALGCSMIFGGIILFVCTRTGFGESLSGYFYIAPETFSQSTPSRRSTIRSSNGLTHALQVADQFAHDLFGIHTDVTRIRASGQFTKPKRMPVPLI